MVIWIQPKGDKKKAKALFCVSKKESKECKYKDVFLGETHGLQQMFY